MTPSRWIWGAALLLHIAVLVVLFGIGPPGWLLSAPLLIVLPWLVRRSRYAFAVNGLLLVWYAAGGMVFLDTLAGQALAWTAGFGFLAAMIFIRVSANEVRRQQAAAASSGEEAGPA